MASAIALAAASPVAGWLAAAAQEAPAPSTAPPSTAPDAAPAPLAPNPQAADPQTPAAGGPAAQSPADQAPAQAGVPPAGPVPDPPAGPAGVPGGPEVAPRPGPGPLPPLAPVVGAPAGAPAPSPAVADPAEGLVGPPATPAGAVADPLDGPPVSALDPLGLEGPADLGRIEAVLARAQSSAVAPARAPRPAAERGTAGLTLRFGLALGLRAEDNPRLRQDADGEGEGRLTTGLSFGVLSQTRTQRLSADVDAGLVASSNPPGGNEAFEIEEPRFVLAYGREGARARLGAVLRYQQVDLGDARLIELDDLFEEARELTVSEGTRTDRDARVELVTGLDRPLGLELALRANDRRYDGAIDPDLTDRTILEASGALRLDLAPSLTTRLSFEVSDLDDASGESRLRRAYGLGASYAVGARTTLTAGLGFTETDALRFVDLDDDGEDDALVRRETSGAEGSLGFVHDMPSGTLSGAFETRIEEGGRRDTLRLARAFEPLRGLDVAASVGLTVGGDDERVVIGDLVVSRALARGGVSAALRRRAGVDADGDTITATSARLGIFQDLDRSSRLALDLDYALVEERGGADESRADLRLSYVRSLTPDWSLSAGYERRRREEGASSADANALFVTLGREFAIRP